MFQKNLKTYSLNMQKKKKNARKGKLPAGNSFILLTKLPESPACAAKTKFRLSCGGLASVPLTEPENESQLSKHLYQVPRKFH